MKGDENEIYIKSNNCAYLLVKAVDRPTCILNAFGQGKNQYLYENATIKKDIKTGSVSGISEVAFNSTWEVLTKNKDVEINK